VRFDLLCNFCLKHLILSRTDQDMTNNVCWSSGEVPVIQTRFQLNVNFLDIFSKNTQISNFMKIRALGAELFRADGRTDMTTLLVAFRCFANAPKNRKTWLRFSSKGSFFLPQNEHSDQLLRPSAVSTESKAAGA